MGSDDFAPELDWEDHSALKVAKEVSPGEESTLTFDFGDDWRHRCPALDEKVDPRDEWGRARCRACQSRAGLGLDPRSIWTRFSHRARSRAVARRASPPSAAWPGPIDPGLRATIAEMSNVPIDTEVRPLSADERQALIERARPELPTFDPAGRPRSSRLATDRNGRRPR